MKPKSALRTFLALAGSTLLAISHSHAATFYWDGADTGANAQGGTGTWINGGTLNWDTLAQGGTDSVWTNGTDTAVFGGTAGTVTIGAGGVTVGGLTFNTTAYTLAAGNNGLTFSSGTNNVWLSAGLNGSPTGTISGTVAVTGANLNFVANPGATTTALTFSGISAGGWTGTTAISGMTLTTTTTSGNINQVLNGTSGVTVNGGAIQFNRATNAQLNAISDSATITVNGGGTFGVTSADAGGVSAIENIGAVTVNSGQMNFNWTNGASSGAQMILSGLTRNGTSALTFSGNLGSTGRWKVTGAGTTTADEIVGTWATTGAANGIGAQTDYAVYSGDFVAARGIAATAESAWSTTHAATSNFTLTNALASGSFNGRLTGTRNINSLRNTSAATNLTSVDATLNTITVAGSGYLDGDVVTFGGTAPGGLANNVAYYVVGASGTTFSVAASSGGTPIDLTSAGTSNVTGGITLSTDNNLGTYGILNGSTALLAIGRSGTGVVTLPSAVSDNLYITAGSAGIAINAPITNNGAGVLTLVKNGSSALFLSGANTYAGGTLINSGNITVSAAAGWVASQNLTFGGTGSLTASVGALAGGTLTLNQGATGSITGSSGITFTTTTGAGQIIYGGGGSAIMNLGDASGFTGNAVLSIGIGGTNPRPTLRFSSMADTAGSYLGWGAAGQGDSNQRAQIELNGNGGALTFDNRQLANLPRTAGNNAAKSLILGNNNTTTAHKWVINTDFLNQGDRGGQGLVLEGSNTGDNAFNGVIGNSPLNGAAMNVYKTGAGKWILGGNNTFTGRLIAGQGTLTVATLNEVGVAGPLGMNNNIQLGGDERTGVGGNSVEVRLVGNNSGTLEYTGAAVTSSRSFFIGDNAAANTGGGTIANNGSGPITFSAATFNPAQAGITATRTLTLAGSDGGEIQGIIQDNVSSTGKVNLAKSGTGTWTLSGPNTYSGVTTIGNNTANVGTLNITHGSALGSGAVSIVSNSGSSNFATLTLNSASGITVANNFTTSGEGQGGNGIIRNVTGNNVINGTFTLGGGGGSTRIQSDGGSLTLSNSIAPNTTGRALILSGSASGTISGSINNGAGANTLAGLTKQGTGTWKLNGTNNYSGLTNVSEGTLGGTGSIAGGVTVAAAGSLAPGDSGAGTLSIGGILDISAQAGGGSGKLTFELGPIATSDKIALTGSGSLTIGGALLDFSDFSFTALTGLQNGTYTLITSASAISGGLDTTPANLTGPVGSGSGTLQITGNDIELVVTGVVAGSAYDTWALSKGLTGANNGKNDNPDGDGFTNLDEFAFDGNPLSGASDGKVVGKIGSVGGNQVLTLTLPVRGTAPTPTFGDDGGDQLSALIDGIYYRIEGSVDLSAFTSTIAEVTGVDAAAIQAGLPALSTGWSYRTFRAPGTVPATAKAFLRARISETP